VGKCLGLCLERIICLQYSTSTARPLPVFRHAQASSVLKKHLPIHFKVANYYGKFYISSLYLLTGVRFTVMVNLVVTWFGFGLDIVVAWFGFVLGLVSMLYRSPGGVDPPTSDNTPSDPNPDPLLQGTSSIK